MRTDPLEDPMANALPTYRKPGRGRPPKYPWNALLNGERKLVTGHDLRKMDTNLKTFRAAVLGEAVRRKIRLRTAKDMGGLALTFPPPSLFAQSKVDWSQWFTGYRHLWNFDAIPFGLEPTAWLDRLKAEAETAGLTPRAGLNRETGQCSFSVEVDEAPDQLEGPAFAPPPGPAPVEWEPDDDEGDEDDAGVEGALAIVEAGKDERLADPFGFDDVPITEDAAAPDRLEDEGGIPLRVVLGAPAAGSDR